MKIRYKELEKPPIRSAYVRDILVGSVFTATYGGRKRILLRTFDGIVDLEDPSWTQLLDREQITDNGPLVTNYEMLDVELVIQKKP